MEGVNPDQVVAMGAALQAHALLDAATETFLVDVTPLTLRIGTVGGFTEKIIDKNTPVPIDKLEDLHHQPRRPGEGEDPRLPGRVATAPTSARCSASSSSPGFRIGYRGEVKIEVTFEIDTNGIVNVSACDTETGQKTTTTITLSSGLSEDDIQRSMEATRQIQLAGHNTDLPDVA